MSRKNPFAGLDLAAINAEDGSRAKAGYGMTGAAKTVVRSIEEMAESTKRLMDGEAIIELDPATIDGSQILDRLEELDDDFAELKTSISEGGQASPILVRPHPEQASRYMVVFGHRRLRVARELGINVRAVVKRLDDTASAIAQGQENSARSNLSFIERAFFAQNLLSEGMGKDVIRSAIGIDDAMLSKMLGVIDIVPGGILAALGACKKIGRDKWLSLRQLLLNPAYLKVAMDHVVSGEFQEMEVDKRFDALLDYMKRYSIRSAAKKPRKTSGSVPWIPADGAVSVTSTLKPKSIVVEFSSADGKSFGAWFTQNLDDLYVAFRKAEQKQSGD
jgi:ParB family chromosome partitioning protein